MLKAISGGFWGHEYIFCKLLHLQKAFAPMRVTDAGKVMDGRLLHPEKAWLPIAETEFPIATKVKLLQFSKA